MNVSINTFNNLSQRGILIKRGEQRVEKRTEAKPDIWSGDCEPRVALPNQTWHERVMTQVEGGVTRVASLSKLPFAFL